MRTLLCWGVGLILIWRECLLLLQFLGLELYVPWISLLHHVQPQGDLPPQQARGGQNAHRNTEKHGRGGGQGGVDEASDLAYVLEPRSRVYLVCAFFLFV